MTVKILRLPRTIGLFLITFVSLLTAVSNPLHGQDVDFQKLDLAVRFDTLNGTVHGQVALSFTGKPPQDSLYLDGIRMNYHRVSLNDQPATYHHNDQGIWILSSQWQDTNSIAIRYSCVPRKGIYFIGWMDESGRSPRQIWTQGQGIDHRHWIPHRDDQTDKLIVELEIEFAESYQVMANGKLLEKTSKSETTTWHYRMHKPMSSYLIALAIGRYDTTLTYSSTGIPLYQYFYPFRAEDYPWFYYKNEEIFDFLQAEIGISYPWQNYKQAPVQDFRHGAMENTTATIFGDFFLVDSLAFNDENYTYVNAHELAHQWFGNLVTATGSDEHWLHEGFATYYQWLSEKNLYGLDRYDWDRFQGAQMVYDAMAIDTLPLGNAKAGSARFYQKGAWVLHMLRADLGDSTFRQVMGHYLGAYAFGLVTTDSLNHSIREISGEDYSEFFERWVRRPGQPILAIDSRRVGDEVEINVRNIYRPAPDIPLRLPVLIQKPGGPEKKYLEIGASDTSFYLGPGPGKLSFWVINHDMERLIKIEETREFGEWKNMYPLLPGILDRHQVLLSLRPLSLREKARFLRRVAADPAEHYALRAEAFRQLIELQDAKALQLTTEALESDDLQLKKQLVRLVPREWREAIRPQVLALLSAPSYQLRADAVHLGVNLREPEENRWLYDKQFKNQPGIRGQEVLIPVLFYRHYFFQDTAALSALIDRSGPAFDFLTRINAIMALANLEFTDETYLHHLFLSLFDPNWKLSSVARKELRRLYLQKTMKGEIDAYRLERQDNWLDFQKRRVERTFDAN